MKRYYIVFKGRVQGVGFRYTLMMLARKLNITGWIKNLYNGDVEAEFQGENADEFFRLSLTQRGFIEIDDYSIKQIDVIDDEKSFEVIY